MISRLDHLIVAVKDLDEAESNYKKIFGVDPVWRGEHKELGTANVIFNFKNTYFELLASNGVGLGSDFVNTTIEESGEGLIGFVLGSENIKLTVKKNDDEKITTFFSDRAAPFIKRYDFIKGFNEGSLDFYSVKKGNETHFHEYYPDCK